MQPNVNCIHWQQKGNKCNTKPKKFGCLKPKCTLIDRWPVVDQRFIGCDIRIAKWVQDPYALNSLPHVDDMSHRSKAFYARINKYGLNKEDHKQIQALSDRVDKL